MNEHLGRGLSALIRDKEPNDNIKAGLGTLPIDKIKPNRYQPRKHFDPERLKELAQSIAENGIIQPLIVSKSAGSDYELIAGERRLEAAKLAGLTDVPVVIRSVSKKEQLQLAIVENIQREDLGPIEEAMAYQALTQDFALTHAQIATTMGKDRVTITNSLRLLKLPDDVIELVAAEELTAGHARAVLMVQPEYQILFARHIIKYKLSVRQAEQKAATYASSLQKGEAEPERDALTHSFEQQLSSIFPGKVSVHERQGKGRITLEYKSPQELQKIKEIIDKLR
ncbi:MAG: ParB/RepB/Spo0J family partition protein [Candidatus Cloacimonadaceae bacterium]|jgi:ParB family chromosome partitioning protein|nr:ParB/RepB/Spo0J family partition protein [Candidatus Cloacimonadota bacterium]MDY0127987.1 ParB/RepB/Spo0J family partition protein [Candidatus Cloacimonadaceae bacterium]MCB5255349.1 ParB/RepB/Spo0J family partition protein [Candidatus Cloacimonadota bacterium]MCK9178236.1 ParB/RepB/Spo0J family partition protein [Candidatus Cloacimonadota bacterium]MCK9242226.1 ParB/RepB/Spo0J family partition protein [Candidatus Cloacimonadota bacterium]